MDWIMEREKEIWRILFDQKNLLLRKAKCESFFLKTIQQLWVPVQRITDNFDPKKHNLEEGAAM